MKVNKICVLGGTGFVGGHIVQRLAASGKEVTVITRHPQRNRNLLVTPGVRLVRADIHDQATLQAQFAEHDAVINLVGVLNEFPRRGVTFRKVHVELAKTVVEACRKAKVKRLLHMSALNADEAHGTSEYLRSKGLAENQTFIAGSAEIAITSFRPSVIFGPDDSFFNRFAQLLRLSPAVFPLACPNSKLSPVYIGDVASAFEAALENPASFGKHYDLCGPRTFTLKELVEYTARCLGLKRLVAGLGQGLSKFQARVFEFAPGKPFTRDNYLSLQMDSVCKDDGLAALGVSPTDIEAVVPAYLSGKNQRQRYNRFRGLAGRG
ncbi:MAG: complex I NDUFA9 subunit family protein [Chromatiales bacterium]|nr:complex I NDUFA9 subunit family protein [Chromatiales bacterium]